MRNWKMKLPRMKASPWSRSWVMDVLRSTAEGAVFRVRTTIAMVRNPEAAT
jgi:hypothetical protein